MNICCLRMPEGSMMALNGSICLNLHSGHQKFSSALVYSAVCKSKSWKQYVHFSILAASMPMCPISLSFENGLVPNLFLKATQASKRIPRGSPRRSTSDWGKGISSGSCSGETSSNAPLVGCAKSHFLAPTARNRTNAPVSGGTQLVYCHFTRITPWPTSMTYNRGSFGCAGGAGSLSSPMQAGLLMADSQHQRLLMRNETMASYSIPSSRPVAMVSLAGAGMAPPVQRYQF
mmetsp:Transcript_40225/g.93134  ORF Transcript_40225/g.93134 Transcript_40225/m.93134 type:complete len:232 (-) Transcript_40225:857-1552(-)